MNINLHNYEDWFQLYVDGELDAQQMLDVEAFAQKHPHLEQALEQLMQTILEAPSITMPGKHLLLKPEEWDADNLENWQQDLLLRLDGESTNDMGVPAVHDAEWKRLQATKLEPEAIAMVNKSRLLSQHMRHTPVVAINWVKRIAVAAAAAAIIWAFWPADEINSNGGNQLVENTTKPSGNDAVVKNEGSSTRETMPSNIEEQPDAPTATFTKNNKKQNENGPDGVANIARPHAPVQYAAISELDVVTHTPIENNQVNIDVLSPAIDTREVSASSEIVAVLPTDLESQHDYLIDEEYLGNNDDADEMVNIGGIKVKKNKIRGILRSVSRNVTRRTSTETIQEAIFPR